MAVPKKRTGHSAQGKRRSNWKATKPELATCPNCGAKVDVVTGAKCEYCGSVVVVDAKEYVMSKKTCVNQRNV